MRDKVYCTLEGLIISKISPQLNGLILVGVFGVVLYVLKQCIKHCKIYIHNDYEILYVIYIYTHNMYTQYNIYTQSL